MQVQTLSSWLNKDFSILCCDRLYPLRNLETMLSMNHCSVNWRWSPGEAKKWRRPVLFITFSPNQSCQEKVNCSLHHSNDIYYVYIVTCCPIPCIELPLGTAGIQIGWRVPWIVQVCKIQTTERDKSGLEKVCEPYYKQDKYYDFRRFLATEHPPPIQSKWQNWNIECVCVKQMCRNYM